MTHEELLDNIYWHWRKDARGDGLQPMIDYRRALLKVVYLHIRVLDPVGRPECLSCRRHYPCPTIQAIDKELA